jgi:hypothetical protein
MAARINVDAEYAARFQYWLRKLEAYAQAALEAVFDYEERHQGLRREAAEAAVLAAVFDNPERSIRPDTARDAQLAHLTALSLVEELKLDWAEEMLGELKQMFSEHHVKDMAALENFIEISKIRPRLAALVLSEDLVKVTGAFNRNLHL